MHIQRQASWLGPALAATLAVGCGTGPAALPGSDAPKAAYRVLVDEDPGPLHSAQRHSYCVRYQCAFTSADYRSSCVKACTDSWALERPARPVVHVVKPVIHVVKPVVHVVTKPIIATGPLYHFDSHHSASPGVIGIIHLPLGRHVFRATHTGSSNFIVYLNVPGGGPEVAFNEIGPGHWSWAYQVQQRGDYSIDIKAADGEWTLDIF